MCFSAAKPHVQEQPQQRHTNTLRSTQSEIISTATAFVHAALPQDKDSEKMHLDTKFIAIRVIFEH
jgi:hypothetical protein